RIPLSRRSHITGFQPVRHKAVEHESALERDFVLLTQFRDPAAELVSQPETIHFMDAGKHRRYTPDFLVLWSDGRRELVEIKYRTDLRTQWSNLRPAFAAARDWAHANGATFRIATERGIRGMELENALRLIPPRPAGPN
ncbi:Tn7 transposase TnsA N-terminal domain-containing protein, partial [Escherichia coli]|uniref:TnsA endonuclease N-terminal domain-containing protein n=1 Tax=Escherichia coli TaxID=562 RepID=UPI001C52DD97